MANVRSLLKEVFGPLLSLTMMTLILPDNNSLLSVDSLGGTRTTTTVSESCTFFFFNPILSVFICSYCTILYDIRRYYTMR